MAQTLPGYEKVVEKVFRDELDKTIYHDEIKEYHRFLFQIDYSLIVSYIALMYKTSVMNVDGKIIGVWRIKQLKTK